MDVVTPIDWLEKTLARHSLTALVFFRGKWCPFCQGYLKELNGPFLDDLQSEGGALYAITADSAKAAADAKAEWGLRYEVMSDPSLTFARRFEIAITPKEETPLAAVPGAYPQGMSQTGVVVMDRLGTVLLHWAVVPSEMTLGGAADRPLPSVLWAALQAARKGAEPVSLDGPRVDPDWLKENHPDAYAIFESYLAARVSEKAS